MGPTFGRCPCHRLLVDLFLPTQIQERIAVGPGWKACSHCVQIRSGVSDDDATLDAFREEFGDEGLKTESDFVGSDLIHHFDFKGRLAHAGLAVLVTILSAGEYQLYIRSVDHGQVIHPQTATTSLSSDSAVSIYLVS